MSNVRLLAIISEVHIQPATRNVQMQYWKVEQNIVMIYNELMATVYGLSIN